MVLLHGRAARLTKAAVPGPAVYRNWTQQAGYPRHLILQIQHPTPYYDDSYAVSLALGSRGVQTPVRILVFITESLYRVY